MTTLPLGVGAYNRQSAAEAEVKLVNRFFEKNPVNLREGVALLSRPGTTLLGTFLPDTTAGKLRGLYSKQNVLLGDLFVTSGKNFYRFKSDGSPTIHIQGLVRGEGRPFVTYAKGIGYERIFISDGLLLQYYDGGTHATGTLTATGAISTQKVEIGGTWYAWNVSVDTGPPDGTSATPWLANPGTDPLLALAKMLMFNGTPGVDFSTALSGPNTQVTAEAVGGPPATDVILTAISDGTNGNSITTSTTGANLAFDDPTLLGGGVHTLHGIAMPNGDPAGANCTLNEFIMVAKAGSNKIYFLRPGTTVIDPLDFFTKESNPDAVVDLLTAGDVFLALGTNSTETWYATGDGANPFAPLQGRTLPRGIVPGTAVLVEDVVLLVGSDGIVYKVGGSNYGAGQYQSTALARVSNHGIEERIRRQLRREAGLTP